METRTAFVTGSTGFLGLNLVEQLLQRGWKVIAFHRKTSELKHLNKIQSAGYTGSLHHALGDITEIETLREGMPEGVDAVFHVAADTNTWYANNDRQTRINVEGTRNVVTVCLEKKAKKLIHTSSVAAYCHTDGTKPIVETDEKKGSSYWVNYHRTKHLAELEVFKGIEQGLSAVLLNPCHIVGKYDTSSWARLFLMIHNQSLPGIGNGTGNFCHGAEVARIHIEAVDKGRSGENYLLGGPNMLMSEFVRRIAKADGRDYTPRIFPDFLLKTYGTINEYISWVTNREPEVTPEAASIMIHRYSVDSSKARTELGYDDNCDVDKTIQETIEFLRQEGMWQ
eukprot:TRINITY_DN11471_c0_g1_i1.p1 TRINITY_DN11471_c0_g1~~TRINITY_DN11471_c0_g1_i1.p1  ORF type:complete len:339 (-),score=65.98 TRINITY_DN11471_c0_g1_i1:272-1288(-)